jgi:hypothetical protein
MSTKGTRRMIAGPVLACLWVSACAPQASTKSTAESPRAASAATTPPAATAPDVCSLLAKADVQAIVGEPMGEPTKGPQVPSSPDVTTSQCMYASADGMKSLSVLVRNSKRGDNAPGYSRQVMVDSGVKVEDVPGVADTAFWAGVQLQAFRGANLQVIVSVMGFARPRDAAVAVARKVLEKV